MTADIAGKRAMPYAGVFPSGPYAAIVIGNQRRDISGRTASVISFGAGLSCAAPHAGATAKQAPTSDSLRQGSGMSNPSYWNYGAKIAVPFRRGSIRRVIDRV